MKTLRRLLTLILVTSLVSGCGMWSKVTGEERRSEKQAQQLSQVQQTCQRFADGFAGKVLEYVSPIIKRSADLAIVDGLSYWQITQLNSAYTIATGASPILCHLDFVVLKLERFFDVRLADEFRLIFEFWSFSHHDVARVRCRFRTSQLRGDLRRPLFQNRC